MNAAILFLTLLASPAEPRQAAATLQAPGFTPPALEAPCRINRHKRNCSTCWHS